MIEWANFNISDEVVVRRDIFFRQERSGHECQPGKSNVSPFINLISRKDVA